MSEYAEASYGLVTEDRESILAEMMKALDEQAHVITTLESRLNPISRPDYDAEKAMSEPRPAQSPIRDFHEGFVAQTIRLQRLLSRLEV